MVCEGVACGRGPRVRVRLQVERELAMAVRWLGGGVLNHVAGAKCFVEGSRVATLKCGGCPREDTWCLGRKFVAWPRQLAPDW